MNLRRYALLFAILSTCFVSTFASTGFSQESKAEYGQPPAKIELQDGDSIVFLGDSITHQCLYTQYVENYFYTRMPHLRLKVHNAGVGGARAWDALQRFDEDVASYKPKYVTILLGMNDGTYQPYNEEVFQTYRQDMNKIMEKLEAINAKAIVMTPTMFDSRAARMRARRPRSAEMLELYNSVLSFYGSWLQEQATEKGLGYVDMFGPLNNLTIQERKKQPDFTMIRDAIHPDAPGQVVMATAIVSDTGLPRQVSNIRISKDSKGAAKARVSGGSLTGLKYTDTGVQFSWTAKCLPWVLPEDADLGVRLTKRGHRRRREALEVHELAAGRYELIIDGSPIGTFDATALGRHIELQANKKTPQYQQAAKVAVLNAERNKGPVRSLRGEWSKFQRYARAERSVKQKPDDAKLAKQLEATKNTIEGMANRVAQFKSDAKAIEDKIFEINQPTAHVYELRRVEK